MAVIVNNGGHWTTWHSINIANPIKDIMIMGVTNRKTVSMIHQEDLFMLVFLWRYFYIAVNLR